MPKVLVPVDGSELDSIALAEAERVAVPEDAEIVLIYVMPPADSQEREREERERVGRSLSEIARSLAVPVRERIEISEEPALGIIRAMDEEKPDMVVMASSDTASPRKISHRSVARQVMEVGTVIPVKIVGSSA